MRFGPLALVSLSALAAPALAQLSSEPPRAVLGARMPALSPDGRRLAFVWRGDVWVGSADGGEARRITDHVELDAYPVFSPDGKWLAFSSLRNGNWDIFVASVEGGGGATRQITFSGDREIVTDWSPDGKSLLFVGQRDVPRPSLFSVELSTGKFTRLFDDYIGLSAPTFSPDGKTVVIERGNRSFPWPRPRYHGSGAQQLWMIDAATGKRTTILADETQHLWPHYSADGKSYLYVGVDELTPNSPILGKPISYTDSVGKTPNLYARPVAGGKPIRLTSFVGGSVRWPSVARTSGDIALEYGDSLYVLPAGSKEPKKRVFFCAADDKQSLVQRQTISGGDVQEAEISPDGKSFVFKLRGDLWTTPVEKTKGDRNADDARRLTDYPGLDEDVVWAEGGKSIFFVSDREGNNRLYRMDVSSKTVIPVWSGGGMAKIPWPTPDGKSIVFAVSGADTGFYSVPADLSAPPKRIVAIPGALQGQFAISPDGRWLAYQKRGLETQSFNLWIAPMDGASAPVNVTRLNASHGQPTWSPDGKYLFFGSDRDGAGLYALPLQPEDSRPDETPPVFVKPTAPVKVEIDFTEIDERIRKVAGQSVDADLKITDDGLLLFVSGGDVWTIGYDGKDLTKRTSTGGVGNLRTFDSGKSVGYVQGGRLYTLKIAPGAGPANIGFTAVWSRNVREERQAAFREFWRTYNSAFHDPNMHGRNWAEVRTRYEPLLDGVETREEFATLLGMMVGELESSHSEVSPAPGLPPAPVAFSLGFTFDYSYDGPGLRVLTVPKRTPGSFEKTRLKPGEYVLAVDGADVSRTESLYKLLNDKGERDWELLVNDKPTRDGARTLKYKALSGGEWGAIAYRNRIDARKNKVDKDSGGKIGYVHISGMGGPNQTTFEREFYERAEGKNAMIIDVRENGGGNIGDTLISWLSTKPFGTYLLRDGYPIKSPTPGFANRAWDRPIVVLMAETSLSNAEMFPYGMRAAGLAKLVGMPTPGYVIWTWGGNLVDGTGIRLPSQGVFRKDGTSLENKGEVPDFLIPWTPEDYAAGRDPQLDKALEILRKR